MLEQAELLERSLIEESYNCEFCGETFTASDDRIRWDSASRIYICYDCEEVAFRCKDCGELHRVDNECTARDVLRNGENLSLCEDCYDNNTWECDVCNDAFCGDPIGDDYITLCNHCAEDFVPCRCCDRLCHIDDAFSPMGGGDFYCENCWREITPLGAENLRCPGNEPPNFQFIGSGDLHIGVELEVDGNPENANMDSATDCLSADFSEYCYLSEEGSVEHGFEIVSFPMTLENHQSGVWEGITSICDSEGFQSHDASTCGLHIHVSKSFFSYVDQVKLAMFYLREQSYFKTLNRREGNGWAEYADPDISGRKVLTQQGGKNCALNFTGHRKTIEFRGPKGTLKASSLVATIEITEALCRFVKANSVIQIEKATWGDFISFIRKTPEKYKNAINYIQQHNLFA